MRNPSDIKESPIPALQHEKVSDPPEQLEGGSEMPDHIEPPPPRAILLEQASKFLKEDQIKDASTERKTAFLQSKGLTEEEVHRLLGISCEKANADMQKEPGEEQTAPNVSSLRAQEETISSPELATPSPARDNPPIITYPEFLLHSQKPAPLITASRLLNTLYLFSGTAAIAYGTSKYLVEPMVQSLTSARHDLFSTTQVNIDGLTGKLEESVSTIPNGVLKGTLEENEDAFSDIAEDMTPPYNRTIGTQTSPITSPTPTTSKTAPGPAANLATLQQSTLGALQTSLASLISSGNVKSSGDTVTDQIKDLEHYLNSLKYQSLHARGLAETKDDAVDKFKAEIRGMKGVLLSARNFPSVSELRESRENVGGGCIKTSEDTKERKQGEQLGQVRVMLESAGAPGPFDNHSKQKPLATIL
ncbi:MAG: hypothetical protein Q9213_004654 [Squamulea squamosa]